MVDVAAMSQEADRGELQAVARDWGLAKLWRTTEAVTRSLFHDGPAPMCARTWARSLPRARERTVLESHLERTFSSFWALPVRSAFRAMLRESGEHFHPEPGESWPAKLSRSGRALARPFRSVADHDRAMEARGLQAPSKREVKPDELASTNERPELARDRR
jgi:hypothetical protein